MLEKIRRIKQVNPTFHFSAEDVNDTILELESVGFVSRSKPLLRVTGEVSVQVIRTAEELEDIAKIVESCLDNPYKQNQLEAYTRFLDDAGALYFSFASPPYKGYFRFYAGEKIRSKETVLFEDVLRSRDQSQEKKTVIYNPEFKAVVLKTLEAINILDDAYLYVPLGDVDSFKGQKLRLRKLGSTFFKKGFGDWFYRGAPTEEGWPRFENAEALLNS